MSSAIDSRFPRRLVRHGTLPQLAALEAVVRLGSATRAAEELCMAQPTLSGHLRKLSEALDVVLFDRQGKRLVPTEAAWMLLQATQEAFDALGRCEARLADLRGAGQPASRPVGLLHTQRHPHPHPHAPAAWRRMPTRHTPLA